VTRTLLVASHMDGLTNCSDGGLLRGDCASWCRLIVRTALLSVAAPAEKATCRCGTN